jgi:hypothetical protein
MLHLVAETMDHTYMPWPDTYVEGKTTGYGDTGTLAATRLLLSHLKTQF